MQLAKEIIVGKHMLIVPKSPVSVPSPSPLVQRVFVTGEKDRRLADNRWMTLRLFFTTTNLPSRTAEGMATVGLIFLLL